MSETTGTTETQVDTSDDLDTFTTEFFGEKKVETPPAKAEVEQEPTEDTDEGETEAQETTDELTDEDEAEAEAEEVEVKPKSKVQERIDELVRQREDAKRDADAKLEALRADFEAKLAALAPAKSTTEETKAAEPTPDDLKEDGSSKYPLGEFDPSYIRDLTRFTLAQERAQDNIRAQEERQAQEELNQKTALQTSWNEKMAPAKERYPDLAEKAEKLLTGFNNLPSGYADYLGTVLMSMDYGPDVLYYLSTNPDEAVKIVNSGAQKATLALGRIEAKYAEAETQKQLAKPRVSKAPPPPSATARGTGGGAQSVAPDTDDLNAFESAFFKKRK